MLAKPYRLTKEKDFQKIFKSGKSLFSTILRLKVLPNSLSLSRFAIVVSGKVSKKAIIRNRLKRQISEVIRLNLNSIKKGYDIVVIVKPDMIGKSYEEIEKTVKISLAKLGLISAK